MKITFKQSKNIFGVAFIIASIFVFMMAGLVGYLGGKQIYDSATTESATTTATITDIEIYRDSDGDRHYSVYVDYMVNEVAYTHVGLGYYTSGMQVGQQVTVKYDINNPGRLLADGTSIAIYIISFIFCLGGAFVFLIVGVKQQKKGTGNKKVLKDETSHRHTAVLVDTDVDRHIRVNYDFPYSYAEFAFLDDSNRVKRIVIGGIKTDSIRSEYEGYSDAGQVRTTLKPGMLADVYTNTYCEDGAVDPNSFRESNIDLENGDFNKARELLENGEI